jgi:16S rRNA (guanine527-N7)-methyltransferase
LDLINRYFQPLSRIQIAQLSSLPAIYRDWNDKINLVSRKDIDHLEERHVLHSLAIARFISFTDRSRVLDLGTGGGFPGIPLAIIFPQVKFHLVDSVGKKITAVQSIATQLNLPNVTAEKARVESLSGSYDFIVSRAVAPLQQLYHWSRHLLANQNHNAIANGWICLKGGELSAEIAALNRPVKRVALTDFFDEDFFIEKYLLSFS